MIKIDGSYGESGGQILRTAIAFSVLTGKSFEIDNIRKDREKPGLKNQHLWCVRAAEKFCNGSSEGAELGSTSLKFQPGKPKGNSLEINLETAGSVTLFLQSLLLPIIFHRKFRISVIGGTDVKFAQPYDFFANVFLPHLSRFATIKLSLRQRGYYPKGQGKIEIEINPNFQLFNFSNLNELLTFTRNTVKGFSLLEQFNLQYIKGISHASADLQAAKVAERQHLAAKAALSKYNCPIKIREEYSKSSSIGSGIVLWAVFSRNKDDIDTLNPNIIGSDALGEKGIPAEKIGMLAAQRLIDEISSKAPVDHYLADQLLPFMAFAPSKIRTSKISKHCLSNIYAIESFIGKTFEVDEKEKVISTIF